MINTRDLQSLQKMVGRLKRVPLKKLSDATCDIIDLKGCSLAVLLRRLPEFDAERQQKIAQKIEDFLYFHPRSGKKLVPRLKRTCEKVGEGCRAQLFSALMDVLASQSGQENYLELVPLAETVLGSSVDFLRKSKALEVFNRLGNRKYLTLIIENMIKASMKLDEFSCYHFFENSLLVLKHIGGESVLKLLINPNSDSVIRQFRFEWKSEDSSLIAGVLRSLQAVKDDFAQIALKVVDLSDFNLPFVSMIQEGMQHQDKWVRQAAAASMEKASSALDPEILARLLNDPSSEVRMMAVSSLGGYSIEKTGGLLESLVQKAGETPGAKMNALHALYSQKNLPALERMANEPEPQVALNSLGLAAMLRPKAEGMIDLLKVFAGLGPDRAGEIRYYLLEIADPEDISVLIDYHQNADSGVKKENCLVLLREFLLQKAGPRLDRALQALPDAQRKALAVLTLTSDVASQN